jgi:hypothetical protein
MIPLPDATAMKLIPFYAVLICFFFTRPLFGDMIFTITPKSPTTVIKGGSISFDILVRADAPVTINGMNMVLHAGAGNGTQGTFSSAATSAMAGTRFFDRSQPGKASVAWGGTTSNITTSDQVFGSFVINTTNSQFGTFSVSFATLTPSALVSFGNSVGVPASYTVSAVPEPSSLVVCAVGGLSGLAYRQWRTRKAAKKR